MRESREESSWRTAVMILAVYAAWLVTTVLSVGVLIAWHTALLRVYVALQFSKWGLALYNNLIVLLVVTIWLVLVVASEGWYRQGASEGVLGRRVGRLLIGLLFFGVCGVALGRVL
jgi:hypothetical protein